MAIPASQLSTGLAGDVRAGADLRRLAAQDPKAAITTAAKQFESLFMQQLLKSMREASMSSGLMENAGSKMGTEMLDAQFAQQMAGLKGGLGDLIARQLTQRMGVAASSQPATDGSSTAGSIGASVLPGAEPMSAVHTVSAAARPASAAGAVGTGSAASATAAQFVTAHSADAQAAQAQTGIPASFILAQAAHESGWGRRDIRMADGSPSNNLFGIKAGAGWNGPVAEVTTTEYVAGEPRKVTAKFRAYATPADAFADYANLMKGNPRYASVLAAGESATGFAQGLQRAGYATDPAYADKLTRVINTTLRLQRAVA